MAFVYRDWGKQWELQAWHQHIRLGNILGKYDPMVKTEADNKCFNGYCHDLVLGYRRGLGWWMDSLTTYTHDSGLQAVTVPPSISTIHKSPQHTLSLFQPVVSSPTVPWQRLLTVEILQLHALRSSLHRLPYRTNSTALVAPVVFKKTPRHGPLRNPPLPTAPLSLRVDSLLRERVHRAVA
jgi:hypothetical protein